MSAFVLKMITDYKKNTSWLCSSSKQKLYLTRKDQICIYMSVCNMQKTVYLVIGYVNEPENSISYKVACASSED